MKNQTLEKSLSREIQYAAWHIGTYFLIILAGILFIITGHSYHDHDYNYNSYYYINILGYIWIGLMVIGAIASFVLWILGIVNAAKINSITNDSIILVVFAVFTFLFVFLIIAVMERTKFRNKNPEVNFKSNNGINQNGGSFESQLKQSFVNGVITSQEYERKLADHKRSNSNK